MRLLITGGTGFIGSRLALRSREMGHAVSVLGQVNNSFEEQNARMLNEHGVAIETASVNDKDRIRQLTQDCEIVFHLAAAQHEANVPDQHFWDVNVEGTKNVLEASIAGGVGRFVHGSTIGVYGSALAGELDEDSPLKPDNIYGITKLEGEKLALSHADEIRVVAIRISETYGPGDRRLLKLFKAVQKGLSFVIGDGCNKHQPVYIDDLLQGLQLAARVPGAPGNVLVLPGREVVSTDEMVSTIARALNKKPPRTHLPLWPFLIAAIVMEKTFRPLGVQPPLHRRRLDFFKKSFFFSHEKAARILGFTPETDFAAGVSETAKWYREQGYL